MYVHDSDKIAYYVSNLSYFTINCDKAGDTTLAEKHKVRVQSYSAFNA